MKRKLLIISGVLLATLLYSCGGTATENQSAAASPDAQSEQATAESTTYDPKRGEGKYDESNVTLASLDASLAAKGESVANTKCTSCHKLTDEKLVGPGWKGVTERRKPYWILNFITNPDPMIDKDPVVQAQLELCLVRMPNQSLTDDEARQVLEFMRKNDGAK